MIDIVIINSFFDLIKCFCKLVTNLDIIQREINFAYHDLIRLRENIIRVCKNHFVLIHDLINSSINISSLMHILQTNIVNYKAIKKLTIQQYYFQNIDDDSNHQYFVDHRFRQDDSTRSSRDNSFNHVNNRFREKFFICFLKKCFVCEKIDC